jgi:hypothetical protein
VAGEDKPEIPQFEIEIERFSLVIGEKAKVSIRADREVADASLQIGYVDELTVGFQASVGLSFDAENKTTVVLDLEGWVKDAVYFIRGIAFDDQELGLEDRVFFEVRNAVEKPRTRQELLEKVGELDEARQRFYRQPLGDRSEPGAMEFQGVVLVERLLMTVQMNLPGVEIRPLGRGNPAESESRTFDEVMAGLTGRQSTITGSEWPTRSEASRPFCILLMKKVHASSQQQAFELVNARAEEVLNLLSLNRFAGATVIGTVVTSDEIGPHLWIQQAGEGYRGNLIGGEIAGEEQHSLVAQDREAQNDQVLELALSLMRSANADQKPDFRYFRYWSILEILADHRVPRKQLVTLLDGTPLLGRDGKPRTTSDAAPRVYEYLKPRFQGVDETSFVAPAASLWEAVEAWYGRRNATAHTGAFDPADPKIRPGAAVLKTGDKGGQGDQWLTNLRNTTTFSLTAELQKRP